jgi:hypothetical protein
MAKRKTLAEIDAAIARWTTKLTRASNTLAKLRLQRMRAKQKAAKAESIPASTLVAAVKQVKRIREAAVVETGDALHQEHMRDIDKTIDTAIPDFLQVGKAAQKAVDEIVAEQIKTQQAEIKKRKAAGRIAKMKAKQRGDLKKMPLTGKAALAAIRDADDEEDWRTSRDER